MTPDFIRIHMMLLGAKQVAAEAGTASAAVKGVGTASATSGAAAATAAPAYSRSARAMDAMRRVARVAVPLVGVALAAAIGTSIRAYREARKIGEQTTAVIKSTGGAANTSAKQVEGLAEKLSLKTGFDDEDVQSATNMLLTFSRIRNEAGAGNKILDRTTKSVLNVAAAMKTDPISAAKQLGKALNDPATGLTALRRSGISFTDQQKEQIATLFESGKALKAQKIILREIDKQTGGSARASKDAFDRFSVAVENLQEKLGEKLFPALTKIVGGLTAFFVALEEGEPWAVAIAAAIGALALAFVAMGIAAAVAWIAALSPAILIVGAIALVGAGFVALYTKVGWFRDAVDAVWGFIKDKYPLLGIVLGPLGGVVLLIARNFGKIKTVALAVFNWLKTAAKNTASWVSNAWNNVGDKVSSAFVAIVNRAIDSLNWLIGAFNSVFDREIDPPGPGPKWSGMHIDPIGHIGGGSRVKGRSGWEAAAGASGRSTTLMSSTARPTTPTASQQGTSGGAQPATRSASKPVVLNLDGKKVGEGILDVSEDDLQWA